ncbi:MAG: long-chain-acyl-CoA synthetase [Syntrophales bacterium]|jgi:citronellyl-CoA synthetase
MTENSNRGKGYIIPEDEFKRQMEYVNTMDPYPPHIFYKIFLEVINRAKKEGGLNWGTMHERAAKKYPNRIAVKWDNSDSPMISMQMVVPHIKYKEFNEAVNCYANHFLENGVRKGDIICILLANRVELLELHVAAAKIGAISSMMNTGWRGRTLAYALNLIPGKAIIVGEECIDLFNEALPEMERSNRQKIYYLKDTGCIPLPAGFIDLKEAVKDSSTLNPLTTDSISIYDPCHLVFTSGTTGGMPKAAYTAHKTMVENANAFRMILDMQKNDTVYVPLPFFHNTFLVTAWPPAALSGGAIAIRRKFSTTHFWSDTRKFRATKFCYVGELCRYLMNQPERPDDAVNPVEGMFGNGLRPEIWKAFKKRFDIPAVNEFYGAAELPSGFVNQYNFDCTIGRSVKSNAVVKYDMRNNEPVRNKDRFMEKADFGKIGLVLFEISESEPLMGYTRKEDTEKKIFRDVFKKGDAWFNTGDLMRNIGYGHRQFVDRMGDTFRWHGENVSTMEVEAVLDTYPQIYISSVYGVKIPDTEGSAGMAAIVPLDVGLDDFDFLSLAKHLKRQLPDFAVPKFLRIKKELDQTPTMKFKKDKLKIDGYDTGKISDPVYVLLPDESGYVPLTPDVKKKIDRGEYRF